MNWLADSLLWLHIIAGFSAFFIGPFVMIVKKGGTAHRQWGRYYVYAMAIVSATAIGINFFRPNLFLFFIAIFSFYFAFSGTRVLKRKRPEKGQKPQRIDWLFAGTTLTIFLAMAGWGIVKLISGQMAFAAVLLVFGGFGSFGLGLDLRKLARPSSDRFAWWYDHMGAMVGSYIAAVTAFSVQNFTFLPAVVAWLWPTAIGSAGLFFWTRHYRQKFSKRPAKKVLTKAPEILEGEIA